MGLAFALIWLGVVVWRRGLGRDGPVMLAVAIALLFLVRIRLVLASW